MVSLGVTVRGLGVITSRICMGCSCWRLFRLKPEATWGALTHLVASAESLPEPENRLGARGFRLQAEVCCLRSKTGAAQRNHIIVSWPARSCSRALQRLSCSQSYRTVVPPQASRGTWHCTATPQV